MNRRYRVYLCWGINRQTTVKTSGDKTYVKIEAPITPLLSSIRSPQIHNEKGKGRPPCAETNVKLPKKQGRGRQGQHLAKFHVLRQRGATPRPAFRLFGVMLPVNLDNMDNSMELHDGHKFHPKGLPTRQPNTRQGATSSLPANLEAI